MRTAAGQKPVLEALMTKKEQKQVARAPEELLDSESPDSREELQQPEDLLSASIETVSQDV